MDRLTIMALALGLATGLSFYVIIYIAVTSALSIFKNGKL